MKLNIFSKTSKTWRPERKAAIASHALHYRNLVYTGIDLFKVPHWMKKTGRILKKAYIPTLLISVLFIQFSASLVAPRITKAAPSKDEANRRWLKYSQVCFDILIDDFKNDGNITSYADWVDATAIQGEGTDNKTDGFKGKQIGIVGMDLDSNGNGIESCLVVFQKTANILRGDSFDGVQDAVGKWIMSEALGVTMDKANFATTGPVKYSDAFAKKLEDLKKEAQTKMSTYPAPTDNMIRERFGELISICFTPKSTANSSDVPTDLDITLPNIGVLYFNGVPKIYNWLDNLNGFNKNNGKFSGEILFKAATNGAIVGYDVGWPWANARLAETDNRFYPMGDDTDKTKGTESDRPGFLRCKDVKDLSPFLFANVASIDASGQMLDAAGKPALVANLKAGDGLDAATAGDQTPDCDNGGGLLSFVLCPLVDGMILATSGIFDKVIEPFLEIKTISTSPNGENNIYNMWSSFRTIGNIVLLLALLVVIFGETFGLSAYSVKKMLPRIFIAAILINISIYILAILNDIVNVIGKGIGNLITSPLNKQASRINFEAEGLPRVLGGNAIGGVLAVGGAAGAIFLIRGLAGRLRTFTQANSTSTAGSGFGTRTGQTAREAIGKVPGKVGGALGNEFVLFFLLFILLPIVIISLAVLITLTVRRGLLFFLIITSPVAFALFAMPGGEGIFKKWQKLTIGTYAGYPTITAMFAMAYVLGVLLITSNDSGIFSTGVGMLVMMIPLGAIPFVLKKSPLGAVYNGAQGMLHKAGEAFKGSEHDPLSLRNRTRDNARGAAWETREKTRAGLRRYSKETNSDGSMRSTGRGARLARGLAAKSSSALSYGQLDARLAKRNKDKADETSMITGYWLDDKERYAAGGSELGVYSHRTGGLSKHEARDTDNVLTGYKWKNEAGQDTGVTSGLNDDDSSVLSAAGYQGLNRTGSRYVLSDGREIDESSAKMGMAEYSHDPIKMQQLLNYDIGNKASTDAHAKQLYARSYTRMRNELGMNDDQIQRTHGGLKFQTKAQYLDVKNSNLEWIEGTGGQQGHYEIGELKALQHTREMANKVGAGEMGGLMEGSVHGLTNSLVNARAGLAAGTGDRAEHEAIIANCNAIANNVKLKGMPGSGVEGANPLGGGGAGDQASVYGRAVTLEAWNNFLAVHSGRPPATP